jgi:hypothetical protein
MYQNPYSRGVSNELSRMVRKYIKNSDETGYNFDGSNMYGGAVHSNANNCLCMEMPCRCYKGEDSTMSSLSGGSGYAAGTRLDSGFERTIGATGSGMGSKVYKKGRGQIGGLPPPENLNEFPQLGVAGPDNLVAEAKVKRIVGGKKGSGLKEIQDDLKKFDFNRIKDYIGLAKPKKGKGLKEVKDDLKKADLNRIKDYVGLGGAMFNQTQLARLPPKNIDKVVERNQMQGVVGGGMSGGDGRKKRAELVKKVMAEKGLSMINASKYVKEKGLYKK